MSEKSFICKFTDDFDLHCEAFLDRFPSERVLLTGMDIVEVKALASNNDQENGPELSSLFPTHRYPLVRTE